MEKHLERKPYTRKTFVVKSTDINKLAKRPVADINYANALYIEAMKSVFDRTNPVHLAEMDAAEFENFSIRYKKSIQRIVRLTLESQIELK